MQGIFSHISLLFWEMRRADRTNGSGKDRSSLQHPEGQD